MTEKLKIVGILIAGLAVLFACIVAAAGLDTSDLIHRRLAAAKSGRPSPVLGVRHVASGTVAGSAAQN